MLIEMPQVKTENVIHHIFSAGVQEELQQIVYIPQPMKKDDDWYILFDVLPKTMEISRSLPGIYEKLLAFITRLSEIPYSDLFIAPSSGRKYYIYHRPTKITTFMYLLSHCGLLLFFIKAAEFGNAYSHSRLFRLFHTKKQKTIAKKF